MPSLLFNTEAEWKEFVNLRNELLREEQTSEELLREENNKLTGLKRNLKGSKYEIEIQELLENYFRSTKPKIMLNNYHKENFSRIFLNEKHPSNQEFDFIMVLGEYRAFIVFEVKSGEKYSPGMEKSLFKGQEMYGGVISYIEHERPDLNFDDWQCIKALVLPNCKERYILLGKLCIMGRDFRKMEFKTLFNLKRSYEITEEYKVMAALMMASVHSASIVNTEGIPQLCRPPSDIEETHTLLAGKSNKSDGPGFNADLLKEVMVKPNYEDLRMANKKLPANSYPAWLFWNPAQARIINQDHKRLIIHGPYGSGKTQVLMALALKAVQRDEKVGFFVLSKHSILGSIIKQFCELNKIDYCEPNWNVARNCNEYVCEVWPRNEILGEELKLHSYDMICIDEFSEGFVMFDIQHEHQQTDYRIACGKFFGWLASAMVKRIACVIAPLKSDLDGDGPVVDYMNIYKSYEWTFVKLTSNMRNSSNVASLAGRVSLTQRRPPTTISVLGPKPIIILLKVYEDLHCGVKKAVELIRSLNERKVVILGENTEEISRMAHSSIEDTIKRTLIEQNIESCDVKEFNSRQTGYWFLHPKQFEGMEARTVILINLGVGGMQYWPGNLTRCTSNLIIITDSYFLQTEYNYTCNFVSPYKNCAIDDLITDFYDKEWSKDSHLRLIRLRVMRRRLQRPSKIVSTCTGGRRNGRRRRASWPC